MLSRIPKLRRALFTKLLWPIAALVAGLPALSAQTMEDGIMLSRRTLCAGALYTHGQWDQYWEGGLERTNGNLGTVTTQSVSAMGTYGITNRINVLASMPFVWTGASQGVLHSQSGFQDLSAAVKVNALQSPVGSFGVVRAIVLVGGSIPTTSYSPDQMPLSIGMGTKTAIGRASLNLLGYRGLYVDGSAAYTLRSNVSLDRPYYYTDGQLYLTNQVGMPNLFDYGINAGYYRHDLKLVANYAQQQSRGGGDIRRQDMPFVSNRMNYSRVGFEVQYPLPRRLHHYQYWLSYSNVFKGRNVGQSNTVTTGVMYTLTRERRTAP